MEGSNKLPWGWRLVKLAEICLINPSKRQIPDLSPETPVTFVPMAAVDEDTGTMTTTETRTLSQVRKGYTYFADGDVIWAKITPCMQNGKAAVARDLTSGFGFGSTEFHVLRPRNQMIPEWVFYYVRRPSFREQATHHFTGSVGQQRVPASFLENYEIPVPPLAEQQRIVGRIEEVTARLTEARRLRSLSAADADSLFPSVLRHTFQRLRVGRSERPLGELVSVTGGGTPSKQNDAYWKGAVPWVSPKDMKARVITDTEDHISEAAVSGSAAKWVEPKSVLVVVRGMILARSFPVALSDVRLTINQDMKALTPLSRIDPRFLAFALRSAERVILSRVEIAAHGTRRLPTEALLSLQIPVPTKEEQMSVVQELEEAQVKTEELRVLQKHSQLELASTMNSVLAEAFRGGL
ncbi:MAG: restriction endonuclease subunit S [Candidatus Methylomirabilales bacterium]